MQFQGKTAVITGAASGIGRALAQALAKENCHLALWDIREAELAETVRLLDRPDLRITTALVDVSDKEAVYQEAERTIEAHGRIQLVINNAGVSLTSDLVDVSIEDYEWIFGINFWGMVYGSKAFLPHLLEQEEACLANVSSIFGIIAALTQGTYNSTKFAIRGFNEALWQELHGTSVHMASIHPGGIKTNIARYGRFNPETVSPANAKRMAQNFDKVAQTTPEQAAAVILKGIKRKKKRILIGRDAKFLALLQRLFPVGYASVVRKQYGKTTRPARSSQ